MSIKISPITGQQYDTVTAKGTWHDATRIKSAIKLAKMFNFELCKNDTEQNILDAIKTLNTMYHDQGMNPSQLVEIYNWSYKADIGTFLKSLGIQRRNLSQAINNYNRHIGIETTDEKQKYWKNCRFRLTGKDIPNIHGFELMKTHRMYHPVNNTNGVSRDHMVSIFDGWKHGYDPTHIGHPANCRFILQSENLKKSSNSVITYEQLLERIENWDKNISLELNVITTTSTAKRSPLSSDHKKKIRDAIKRRHQLVKAGKIIVEKRWG